MNFIYSLPPANEVWGKVIYLQVCVYPQGGCLVPGGAFSGGAWSGGSGPGGGVPGPGEGECLLWGGAWGVPGGCLVETPQTATAAGGTHPTGMHSCLNLKYKAASEKNGFHSEVSIPDDIFLNFSVHNFYVERTDKT